MAGKVPLATALSQVWIAWTIELDGEFERRMPHSTTVENGAGLGGGGPWLVSQVMWSNYLRHIDEEGTRVAVVQARSCSAASTVKSRLNHLSWWGYLTVQPPASARAKYADHLVTLTQGGRRACEVFEPLPPLIEGRWRTRFGHEMIEELRGALAPFVLNAPEGLPRSMPVVDYGSGMRTHVVLADQQVAPAPDAADAELGALVAQTLLLLTLAFEAKSTALSLPHLANVLRVVEERPTSIKELPARAGVSKQSIDASVSHLVKAGLLACEGKGMKAMLRLTPSGLAARKTGRRHLAEVEKEWERGQGKGAVDRLRNALDAMLAAGEGPGSKLAEGLSPDAGAWRAHKNYVRQTEAVLASPRDALPHHPMVLHRGGFPDGS